MKKSFNIFITFIYSVSLIKLYATIFFNKDKALKYILIYFNSATKYIGVNIISDELYNSVLKFSKVLLLSLWVLDGITFFKESIFCKAALLCCLI